jgi:hypothetical protein
VLRLVNHPLREPWRGKIPIEQLLPAGAIYFTIDEADVRRILACRHGDLRCR